MDSLEEGLKLRSQRLSVNGKQKNPILLANGCTNGRSQKRTHGLLSLHNFGYYLFMNQILHFRNECIILEQYQRNQQIVQSVQAALKSPRTPSVRLIECEFPVLALLNKQGDGSLSSSTAVDDANLVTAKLLVQSLTSPLSSLFSLGTAAWLLTSTGASNTLQRKASATVGKGGALVHSLKDGLPRVKSRDVCVLLSPCTSADYSLAKQLVANGNAVVLVNGIAKDNKSVSGDATMAYYLKPLTYNSNRVGYLVRSYPGPWTVLYDDSYSRIGSDSSSNRKGATITNRAVVLATVSDAEILVPGTNTPDLRGAGRLVQKAVGERDSRNR